MVSMKHGFAFPEVYWQHYQEDADLQKAGENGVKLLNFAAPLEAEELKRWEEVLTEKNLEQKINFVVEQV